MKGVSYQHTCRLVIIDKLKNKNKYVPNLRILMLRVKKRLVNSNGVQVICRVCCHFNRKTRMDGTH